MPAPSFWESILEHLKEPEYVHVLLNPLPIYGVALGALALAMAMILKSRPAQITALMILFIGGGSAIPVVHYGDAGYDVVESKIPDDANAWLDAHGQRALRALPAYYALAGLCLVALFAPWKWPKAALPLNALALALALCDLGLGAWIGYAGGQAMHEEFRSGLPAEPVGGYDKMR